MKLFKTLGIISGFGAVLASSQTPPTDVAIAELRKSNPETRWKTKSAIVADVTCDRQPDTVVLGSEKGRVVVAVVPASHTDKPQVFRFPIARDKQDGFCAAPQESRQHP